MGVVVEEKGSVAEALARLGHPVGDGLFPAEIVGSLLVGGEIFLAFVGLIEEEARGVFLGLEEIEAEVGGFLARVPGVVEGGGFEGGDVLGLDENGDADDVHGGLLARSGAIKDMPRQ